MLECNHESVVSAVAARLQRYNQAKVCAEICECDGMYARGLPGADSQYFSVGRSAIDLIARAMIAGRRPKVGSVLDLPCGGGRVTRHLVAFLPDAAIYVAELNKRNEEFVTRTFGVSPISAPPDFGIPPTRSFDLVFVGSLLTHLPADRFAAALKWFISALAPDGLLVATTHGRQADDWERTILHHIDPRLWSKVERAWKEHGFGYVETERNTAGSYGYNLTAPSWVLNLVENDPSCRVLGFEEAAWNDHQDAIILQRRPSA